MRAGEDSSTVPCGFCRRSGDFRRVARTLRLGRIGRQDSGIESRRRYPCRGQRRESGKVSRTGARQANTVRPETDDWFRRYAQAVARRRPAHRRGLPPHRVQQQRNRLQFTHRRRWSRTGADLERRVNSASPQLRRSTRFVGSVRPDEIPAMLAQMDIAVAPYPSLPGFYFSPLKIFEYMAAGLAVVASCIGQNAKVIEHGKNGILTRPGDIGDLVEARRQVAVGFRAAKPARSHGPTDRSQESHMGSTG